MDPTPAGREDVVRLIDQLVDRRCHRVPIVSLVGPGGSGKAETLRYLQTRYDRVVPVARIDLSDMRADDTQSLIELMYGQLRTFANRNTFGRLRLPRTELAMRVLRYAEDEDRAEEVTRASARRLILASRDPRDPLPDRPDGPPPPLTSVFQWLWFGVLAVLFLQRFRVQIPSVIRRVLAPRNATSWAWYEKVGGTLFARNVGSRDWRVDDVVVKMVEEIERANTEPGRWKGIEDLLVGAFLADICGAYRRRRFRRVRCVLLIGNADLLSAQDNLSLLTGQSMRLTREGLIDRFIEVSEKCCTHRKRPRRSAFHVPLVLVLSSQAGPLPAAKGTPQNRYDRWSKEQAPEVVKPFLLLPMGCFGLRGTRSFLNQLSYQDAQTELRPFRISEIYSASRGHPHALTMVLAEEYRSLRDLGTGLPVRQILSRPDVTQELLSRFLQRFPESGRVRQDTRDVLSVLALANRIDLPVTAGLLRIHSPSSEARPDEILERLRRYSFMARIPGTGDDLVLTMHPLLRDLLTRRLIDTSEKTYTACHRFLADHFRAPADEFDRLYHRMALGEVTEVSRVIERRYDDGDDSWLTAMEYVCVAPGFHEVESSGRSDDTPRLESLLIAMWSFESVTSEVGWDEPGMADVLARITTLSNADRKPAT